MAADCLCEEASHSLLKARLAAGMACGLLMALLASAFKGLHWGGRIPTRALLFLVPFLSHAAFLRRQLGQLG